MIFTERTITVVNDSATINKPLILYRGDKNIELKITIVESQFKFRSTGASNVIETSNASYAQLVINTPYNSPIFSEVTATENGTVIFVISAAMIDEVREVGAYEIQIRLLDDNKQSRASIPPVSNAIEIREPIAIEDGSAVDSNAVNVAKVNRALTTTSAPLKAFDSQGNYIKNNWGDGDPITDAALNKIEVGIDGVNKKIGNVNSQIKNIANEANSYFELAGERNLFGQDRYLTGYFIDYNSQLGVFRFIKSTSGVGKIAIVEIEPNTQYSIVKEANTLTHNNKTMFVYGTDSAIFNQGDSKRALDGLQARVYETHVTFTSNATDNYLYIYFSDDVNSTEHIQVTKGETAEFLPSGQFYVPSDKLKVYSIDEADQKFKRQDGTSKHITKFYIPNTKVPDYAISDCVYNELPDLTTFYSYFDSLVDNVYVTKTTIGNEGSTNAYPIHAYRFKPASPIVNNKAKNQVIPKLIVTSCIHGGEKPSAFAMLNLCKKLKDNWVENAFLTYLRFNIELIVVPILNPWGYVNNTRGNYNHVDLNRNFDYNWANQGSTDSTDQRYRGTSANSENETQAIINFVNAEKNNLLGHIDVHALGSGDTSWELLYRHEISNEDYEDVFLQMANSNLAETTAKGIAECNVPATINTQLGKIGIGYDSAAIDNYFNSKGIISTCCEVAYRYVDGTDYHTDVNKLNTYFMATCIKNFINTFLYL